MRRRRLLYITLAVLYLVHNDFWFWHQPRLVLGLPAGLAYHVLYCFAVSAVMALLVRTVWPRGRPVA